MKRITKLDGKVLEIANDGTPVVLGVKVWRDPDATDVLSPVNACPSCDGRGHHTRICAACEGAGHIDEDCFRCAGTGENPA
jgi:hypothetical protein